MEKYIQKAFEYSKSLKIDDDSLKELDRLYTDIGAKAKYSIVTENDIHYNFDNLEELLEYEFSNEIRKLRISKYDYTRKENLDIEFNVDYDYLRIFTVYGTISKISYSTSNENIDILLHEKLSNFYKRNATYSWIIGKIGIYGYLLSIFYIIGTFAVLRNFLNHEIISFPTTVSFFVCFSISMLIFRLMKAFDRFVCKKFFNPIIYYIGKQKEKNDKLEKIKSNIFWGVIVAIIVGIITTVICNHILK